MGCLLQGSGSAGKLLFGGCGAVKGSVGREAQRFAEVAGAAGDDAYERFLDDHGAARPHVQPAGGLEEAVEVEQDGVEAGGRIHIRQRYGRGLFVESGG
jgi:hypothetical protein